MISPPRKLLCHHCGLDLVSKEGGSWAAVSDVFLVDLWIYLWQGSRIQTQDYVIALIFSLSLLNFFASFGVGLARDGKRIIVKQFAFEPFPDSKPFY